MNNHVIGLDCGASHSTLVVWFREKMVLERNDLPGLNMDLIDLADTKNRFLAELETLKEYEEAHWVVGVAGLDDKNELVLAERWWRHILESTISYYDLTVMSDVEMVLWAGSRKGEGVGLIAGTGSNCLGRKGNGLEKKVGGMSHLLSDEGAGFSLAWKGLHMICKMADGRLEKSEIHDKILNFYEVTTIVDLKNYLLTQPNQKVAIARCAPVILLSADRGEPEVVKLVDEESSELVKMVVTVKDYLGDELLSVYIAGSIFMNGGYKDRFILGLREYFPVQKVSLVSPIAGALNFVRSKN